MLMDYPAHVVFLSTGRELRIPFSDLVKYCILGISVTLLLLALGILVWQAFRCFTQDHTTTIQQDNVSSELLYLDGKSRPARHYSGAPSTRVEVVNTEVRRLSRCLPPALIGPSGFNQAEADMGEQANIKKVDGSLRFSLYYDQPQSQLVVTVLQVEGLVEPSQARSPQPFVKLRLLWADLERAQEERTEKEDKGTAPVLWTVMQEWRTRIVKGSCNPFFGDQFSFTLQEGLHHISLKMEVRDFDKFSRHTVFGEVRVSLGQLNIHYPLELHEDLKIPQKDLVGEVLLSLKVLPTSQRIEVGLLKIRMVHNERCSDTALYARISMQCNQCKLRYQKTSAVSRCLVTVFNEVLMFSLPELPLEYCKISVSVYETQPTRKSTKQLVGQLIVGKEKRSEDEHWSLMMQSIRQPIAKWHGLLI